MTSSADLASLYQLLAKQERPILPSGEKRGIIGTGYVGEAIARAWRQEGHELWGTTTRRERLSELAEVVDTPVMYDSTDSSSSLAFTQDMDAVLVSFAPSKLRHVDIDQYRVTFLGGVRNLVESLTSRTAEHPVKVVYLSSCGVYGNRGGRLTNEDDATDDHHPVNQVLAEAEAMVQSIRSENISVCVLRLGGIYGPERDIPGMLRSAAGQFVQRNGRNVPCWIHLDDIVKGIDFAFDHDLNQVYNLVNDTQMSGQEITDYMCEQAGLPLATWLTADTTDRVLNAKVSNEKIKGLGFTFTHPSFVD